MRYLSDAIAWLKLHILSKSGTPEIGLSQTDKSFISLITQIIDNNDKFQLKDIDIVKKFLIERNYI
jgi:hypothetical protein